MKIQHKENYKQRRKAEYPAIEDQIDAIYKMAVKLQNSGVDLPMETNDWLSAIDTIKKKYPKG